MDEPRVGIFWMVNGNVLAFTEPLDHVRPVNGVRDSDLGHDDLWPLVQRRHPQLRSLEYWQVPRGRVLYRERERRFDLLMPAAEGGDRRLVAAVAERFALPAGTFIVASDVHYEPPGEDLFDD